MTEGTKATGSWGERVARAHLERRGYRIREMNYRCPYGEIDIVAEHGDWLVFVEVRTRRSRSFGTPEESVTARKAEHLRSAVEHYCQNHAGLPAAWRIDLLALEVGPGGRVQRIAHIENAIS
ncbi:MAG: YraN family protein [Chloroflexi bacterium]|nr:YraN family protein [Chloroflexota bacterium]